MSFKGSDGFDHYNSFTDMQLRVGALSWSSGQTSNGGGTYSLSGNTRFSTGKSLLITCQGSQNTSAWLNANFGYDLQPGYIGFSLYVTQQLGQTVPITFQLYDLSNPPNVYSQAAININPSNGQIYVTDKNGGTVASSALAVTPSQSWMYFEIGATIGNPGTIIVRVNQTVVLTATGNFQSGPNASFDMFRDFLSNQGSLTITNKTPDHYIDDFIFNDGASSDPGTFPNNNFIGDCRIVTLFPDANNTVSWTPLANANWQEVSETAFDGDASYNYTGNAGSEDLFNINSLPTTSVGVVAVQVVGAYRKDDSGNRTLTQHIKSGSTDAAGATRNVASNYVFWSDIWVVNPATGVTWLTTEVNAMQIGYKLDS
jgi:hypothetical protein